MLLCEECLGHGAPVKGDVARETEGSAGTSAPLRVLGSYGPMSMRLTSGDATDALSRSSRDEREKRIMGKTAQVGAVSHSSARK